MLAVPLNPFAMSIAINDELFSMIGISTHHGEVLIAASELTAAVTGCNLKYASSKVSLLYKLHPQLRPASHGLQHHSQVCNH